MSGVTAGDEELDAVAAAAWPARVVERLGPWLCRFTDGFTNRANSVAVLGRADADRVPILIGRAQSFYKRQAAPAKFQVSLTSRNESTIMALGEAGFVPSPETQVMVAPVVAPSLPPQVTVAREPTNAWFETWWEVGDRGGDRERRAARGLLKRMTNQGFATLSDASGRAVAVGLGQYQDHWLGIFAMGTVPDRRRRGHGRQVLDALCGWGYQQGARKAYLQVPVASSGARRLSPRFIRRRLPLRLLRDVPRLVLG